LFAAGPSRFSNPHDSLHLLPDWRAIQLPPTSK
jgi:hypothetical protein